VEEMKHHSRITEWVMIKEGSNDVSDALFRVSIDSHGAGEFITVDSPQCRISGRIEIDVDEAEVLLNMIAKAHNAIVDAEGESKGSDE
jgi:hypothetical protein